MIQDTVKQKNKIKVKKQRGVVLLIAVSVAGLVLVIGIGILNVMTKELVLGSLSKQSRVAFFAADSGIECVMHWDMIQIIDGKRGADGTYSTSTFPIAPGPVADRNAGIIDSDFLISQKYNPFCAGQEADNIMGTDTGANDYLNTYFGITDPSSYTGILGSGGVATTQFVFFPGGTVSASEPCVL
ncbi:MAG: hypothetical protein KAS07_04710, partial [Candidatus Pacebacteria bacterium]|nr:hypothetical protein [Candidatus Paceibacterota bacterium]